MNETDPVGESIAVLLVGDQPLLRKGFRMVLEEEPGIVVVGDASDGIAALELVAPRRPDVVVMDVRMPRMDGIRATQAIVETDPHARVLILTTFDLDEYAFGALRLGASGFILKDVPPAAFVSAIRAVADGDAVIAPTVTRRLLDRFGDKIPDPQRGQRPHPELDELTAREREILVEVVRLLQRRGGRAPVRRRGHGQDPSGPGSQQAGSARPGPGGHLRLPVRSGRSSVRAGLRVTGGAMVERRTRASFSEPIRGVAALAAHRSCRPVPVPCRAGSA